MPDEFLKTNCPACRQRLRIPQTQLHRKISCPQCDTRFRLSTPQPEQSKQSAAPSANQNDPPPSSRESTPTPANLKSLTPTNPPTKAEKTIFDLDFDDMFISKSAEENSEATVEGNPTSKNTPIDQLRSHTSDIHVAKLAPDHDDVDQSPPAPKGLVSRGIAPAQDNVDIYRPEKPSSYKSEFEGSIEYKLAPSADQAAQRELYEEARAMEDQRSAVLNKFQTRTQHNGIGVVCFVAGFLFCVVSLLVAKTNALGPQGPWLLACAGLLTGMAGAAFLTSARLHQGFTAILTGALFAAMALGVGIGTMYFHAHNKPKLADANESEPLDPVKKHVRELERIADEKKKKQPPKLDKFDNIIREPMAPNQVDDNAENKQRPQIAGLPQNPFRQQERQQEEEDAEPFQRPENQFAFKIINGDPDGEFDGIEVEKQKKDANIFAPDQNNQANDDDIETDTVEDKETAEGDLIDQFNQMLGQSEDGAPTRRRRQPAIVRNRWVTATDILERPEALRQYEVSELLGKKSETGKAMTNRNPIIGFDFVDDPRLIWISPVFESDPLAIETLASNDPNFCLAGIKLAFKNGQIVGAQAIFAPRAGNALDIRKTENSIWLGERTRNVKTCISTGMPVFGMVIYRGAQNVVGVSLLAK